MAAKTSTSIAVKFSFDGEFRRVKFDGRSYADLEARIRTVLGFSDAPGKKLVIKFKDSDEDWVSISSDAELAEVLALNKGSDVLRLSVERKAKKPTAAEAIAQPPKPSDSVVPAIAPLAMPAARVLLASAPAPSPQPSLAPQPQPSASAPAPAPAQTKEARLAERMLIREKLIAARKEKQAAKLAARLEAKRMRDTDKAPTENSESTDAGPLGLGVPAFGCGVGRGQHWRRRWEARQEAAAAAGLGVASGEGDSSELADRPGFKGRYVARFIKHVGLEDGAELAPGTKFTKTWRFRNDGATAWPAGASFIFVGKGDRLAGPDSVPVVRSPEGDSCVAPGDTVDVSVNFEAPNEPGRYLGYWRMATANGRKFGQRVWIEINVVNGSSSSSSSGGSSSDSDSANEMTPIEAAAALKEAEKRQKELFKELRRTERQKMRAEKVAKRAKKAEGAKKEKKKKQKAQTVAAAVAEAPKPAEQAPVPLATANDWEPFISRLNELGLTIVAKPTGAAQQ